MLKEKNHIITEFMHDVVNLVKTNNDVAVNELIVKYKKHEDHILNTFRITDDENNNNNNDNDDYQYTTIKELIINLVEYIAYKLNGTNNPALKGNHIGYILITDFSLRDTLMAIINDDNNNVNSNDDNNNEDNNDDNNNIDNNDDNNNEDNNDDNNNIDNNDGNNNVDNNDGNNNEDNNDDNNNEDNNDDNNNEDNNDDNNNVDNNDDNNNEDNNDDNNNEDNNDDNNNVNNNDDNNNEDNNDDNNNVDNNDNMDIEEHLYENYDENTILLLKNVVNVGVTGGVVNDDSDNTCCHCTIL